MDIYEDIRGIVEAHYSFPPMLDVNKHIHFMYLRATGRGHFNEVTFLTDGRLMLDNRYPNLYLQERTEAITGLGNYLADKGTPFLYVRIPNKLQDNSLLPRAFSDNHIIENGDNMYNQIAENGIDTFDLRAEMNRDNIDFASAFFRYHLHWTYESTLWASRSLGNYINREYGFNIDLSLWDLDNFDQLTFKRAFNGIEAEFTGGYHVREDITFFVPRYHVDFEMRTSEDGYGVLTSDSFTQLFIPSIYNGNDEFAEYDIRLPGAQFTGIRNNNVEEEKRVLLISDSYALSWASMLSLGLRNLDFVYLITDRTHLFLWHYLRVTDYDLVIFALSDVTISIDSAPEFERDRLYLGTPPNR